MNNLQIFQNEEFGEIRIMMIEDEPWWVLKDVCNVLELTTPHKVANRLDEDERTTIPIIDSLGRQQATTIINEQGLYSVILQSRKPEAKQFKRWITHQVLPSIRKHGAYFTTETFDKIANDPNFLLTIVQNWKEEREQREILEEQLEENAPLVLFAESVQASSDSILIGELSKILKQKGIKIGRKRLFDYLRSNGYLMKTGSEKNQPTQYSMERGWFEIKKGTFTDAHGETHVTKTTMLTAKGQLYFINVFLKQATVELTVK